MRLAIKEYCRTAREMKNNDTTPHKLVMLVNDERDTIAEMVKREDAVFFMQVINSHEELMETLTEECPVCGSGIAHLTGDFKARHVKGCK